MEFMHPAQKIQTRLQEGSLSGRVEAVSIKRTRQLRLRRQMAQQWRQELTQACGFCESLLEPLSVDITGRLGGEIANLHGGYIP